MGEKAKRVKLDYDAICDELDIQGKSKTWLSTEIGRSRSYFSNLPGTRLGATVQKNMEELITDRNGVEQTNVFSEADKRNISRKDILRAKNEMDIRVTTRGIGANSKKYWCKG